MMKAASRGIALALLILFIACIGGAVLNRGAFTRVEIDNQEWQQATVRILCDGYTISTLKVGATDVKDTRLYLGTCNWIAANVTLFGSPRYTITTEAEMLQADDRVKITIPHGVDQVFLALYPER